MEYECYNLINDNRKKCYGCQKIKSLDDFCKDKLGIGGYKNQCRDCQKVQRSIYSAKNKDKEKAYNKLYKDTHKEEGKKYSKQWISDNPDKVAKRRRRYYLENMKKPKFRIEQAIVGAIKKRIIYHRASGNLKDRLGYSAEELVAHLESKFKPEMNWNNYGKYWHIDHIKPKSWFKYETEDDPEFKSCWAISNLQPLEATINMSKQNRYEG